MAAKKTTAKKATAKTAKPRVKAEAAEAETKVESILKRIQDGFKEAGAALAESGAIMDEKRREILLTLIENAQVNTDSTFNALRGVMEAESVTDSLRIQRDALRDGIERNLSQVRDVASLTAQSGRETIEPVAGYLASLRSKAKSGANA
ncbi:MAG: phasin family protein [Pseudomonadota bacterium]|nr:phasin family protein [Pseudomonadota bacterium]